MYPKGASETIDRTNLSLARAPPVPAPCAQCAQCAQCACRAPFLDDTGAWVFEEVKSEFQTDLERLLEVADTHFDPEASLPDTAPPAVPTPDPRSVFENENVPEDSDYTPFHKKKKRNWPRTKASATLKCWRN